MAGGKNAPSKQVYAALRDSILQGEFAPRQALRPQALADAHGVSLAVVREALLRLVGEGLAVRSANRGFAVPAADAGRWQLISEARAVVEPSVLRMSVTRGDLEWEASVRAAYHRLARTPVFGPDGPPRFLPAWSEAHRVFHRSLLEGCGNPVLLDTFDRMWISSELVRRWSASITPDRDSLTEHAKLERAALSREGDQAADLLARHTGRTAAVLADRGQGSPG
jgi:DNA-binding GntR family transcriptional regulator